MNVFSRNPVPCSDTKNKTNAASTFVLSPTTGLTDRCFGSDADALQTRFMLQFERLYVFIRTTLCLPTAINKLVNEVVVGGISEEQWSFPDQGNL